MKITAAVQFVIVFYSLLHNIETTTLAPKAIAARFSAAQQICTGPHLLVAPLCHQYYECVGFLFFWWRPILRTCPEGKGFSEASGVCVDNANIGCSWPDQLPNCSGSGIYPAPLCYQYYECVPFLWWWKPQLRTCPHGQVFDMTNQTCDATATLPNGCS